MSKLDKIIGEATKLKDLMIVVAALVPQLEPIVMATMFLFSKLWPQNAPVFDPAKVAAQIAEQRRIREEDDAERNKRRTTEPEE